MEIIILVIGLAALAYLLRQAYLHKKEQLQIEEEIHAPYKIETPVEHVDITTVNAADGVKKAINQLGIDLQDRDTKCTELPAIPVEKTKKPAAKKTAGRKPKQTTEQVAKKPRGRKPKNISQS